MFPIRNGLKQGDALLPLLFNFVLDQATRRVQVNQEGLKLNDTHQHFVYTDDVNILSGSLYTIMENKEAFVLSIKEQNMLITLSTRSCVENRVMYGVTV